MRKKATVFRGKGKNKSSDDDLHERKKARDLARYYKKRKEILSKQAKYYDKNKDEINARREDYTDEYNREHSVRFGDARYQKKGARKYEFKEAQ